MGDLQKVMGIATTGIQKVMGIPVASIQKVMGLTYPASGPTYISNADLCDEDMAVITDWTDNDDYGDSSQVTFDGKSCMKLITGGYGSMALRTLDVGTFGDRTVCSFSSYIDTASETNVNFIAFRAYNGTKYLRINLSADGFFSINWALTEWIETGSNIVVLDAWQEWTFDIDWTAYTFDLYLGQILQATDVACNLPSAVGNGTVQFQAYRTNAEALAYVDWFKAGSKFVGE